MKNRSPFFLIVALGLHKPQMDLPAAVRRDMKETTREKLVFLGTGILVILIAAGPKIVWLLRTRNW